MAKIRLHLGNLNIVELIALGRQVHATMSDNPAFEPLKFHIACLADEIDEMTNRSDDYKAALLLVQERLTEQQDQRATLENLLTNLATGVANICGDSAGMIQRAGFDVPVTTAPSTASAMSGTLPAGMERVVATN